MAPSARFRKGLLIRRGGLDHDIRMLKQTGGDVRARLLYHEAIATSCPAAVVALQPRIPP
jgi:hypothetical protein